MDEFTSVPAAKFAVEKKKRPRKQRGKKSQHPAPRSLPFLGPKMAAKVIEKREKYMRGQRVKVKGVTDKKLKARIKDTEADAKRAVIAAARAEILLPESVGYLEAENATEKTYKFNQQAILEHVDANTAAKALDLKLEEFSPYRLDFARNGRHMVIGGRKGHLSLLDALRNTACCEVYVNETVRDVKMLHNHTMFAAAQKKKIYIYDDKGVEIHRLKSHVSPSRLEFLPYHFLLASVGSGGWLKYQDTSTGELVSEHRTKLGPCDTMVQNPYNAVISLGHGNGTVTMWSPSQSSPLVKMLCHKGPVSAIAFDRSGHHMVTAGLDGKVTVWDARMYKKMHSYFTHRPPKSIDVSQTGLLAVSSGYQTHIWKDALRTKAQDPYMRHPMMGSQIECLKFRPYEDILGIGTSKGIQTVIVPGSGEPNFDAFEANPFENTKQRREGEVQRLLEKLQPDMIVLNPDKIGGVQESDEEEEEEEVEAEGVSAANRRDGAIQTKNKMRGKNKYGRKLKRKRRNIIDEEKLRLQRKRNREADAKAKIENETKSTTEGALSRFDGASRKKLAP